jgi:3'-phosphoadenosine 5'-phosphosulfate sulfotransferase (PAPS reductase)/FAD synthetase
MSATEQLRLLHGEDADALISRAKMEHRPIRTFCLFSGGNDSTVLAHRCREHYDELVHIDTGTAVPGVRGFVEEFASWVGRPLRVMESGDEFRRMVLGPLGFPGPAQHNRCYQRLKARQIERLLRETKDGHPRSARVLHLTGLRRAESQRRSGRPAVDRKGSSVFVSPLIDWTAGDMARYRRDHGLPQSDVAAILHRSGECNCGSFAAPGEREELQFWFPEWFEETIASLEREAEARGIPECRWGNRPGRVVGDAGELCSDCQLRIFGVDEEKE